MGMTKDERGLLLELAKAYHGLSMGVAISGKPLLAAIHKIDPDYSLQPMPTPDAPRSLIDRIFRLG